MTGRGPFPPSGQGKKKPAPARSGELEIKSTGPLDQKQGAGNQKHGPLEQKQGAGNQKHRASGPKVGRWKSKAQGFWIKSRELETKSTGLLDQK
jgi:hypothetical protein